MLIDFCDQLDIPQLTTEQQTSCEGKVSSEEAGYALSTMENDSAPGTDGLTASFYKFFWKEIKHLITESFNEDFNCLSVSQRRAIITLIHKGKDLPKDQLGNWRPISLTNVDYKILTKSLALRLQNVIKSVVLDDQVVYIKGRNISTIIRFIDDVVELLPKYRAKDINHLIIVAKMCISKFVYGDYGNLLNLFEHELKMRKIFQT